MKKSVQKRHVLIAMIAVGTVLISGVPDAFAQKLTYRQSQNQQAQHEMGGPAIGPTVDLPSPRSEASVLPSMDDVVPPSLQPRPAMGGGVAPAYESYSAAPYSEPMMDGQMMDIGTPLEGFAQAGLEPICYSDDGPAPIYSTGSWWWRGNWYTQMDVVVLDRSEPRNSLIAVDPNINGLNFTNTSLAKLNYEPGARLTLGKFLGRDASSRDYMIEFSFLGLFDWNAGRVVNSNAALGMGTINQTLFFGSNDLFVPFNNADRQTYEYSSNLNDFQLNYRLQTRPGKDVMALQPNGMWVQHAQAGQVRSLLMGLRASGIDETVNYTSSGLAGVERGQYIVRTNNDMFGVHFGGELIEVHDEFSIGLRGKVGSLVNFIDRRSSLDAITLTNPAGISRTEKITDEKLSWVLEAGVFGKYQVRPNLAFRFGYDVTLYSSIALAPENLGFTDGFADPSFGGTPVFHGASFGFDTTW